jgi:hypothetical protein
MVAGLVLIQMRDLFQLIYIKDIFIAFALLYGHRVALFCPTEC